jgi:predicted RNase H-like HicB family nuclease
LWLDQGVYAMSVAKELSYTAVYEEVEGGWTQARIAEIPGVITAGPSRQEAKLLLQDALREYLASFMEPNSQLATTADREHLVLELVPAPVPKKP